MTPTTATGPGNYWVDLTIVEAFEAGKKLLPPGDEPLIAYYINAIPLFLKHLGVFPPPVAAQPSSNDLALFLCSSKEFFLLSSILQVVGCLEASIEREGQRCRKISENQLEISWKTDPPLYLHLPVFFEESLELIGEALKHNEPATAQLISRALDLVVPSFFDLPAQGCARGRNETLNEIYRAFCRRKNFYAAFKLLFLFKGAGWNPLETRTVLDLPEQLSFIARSNQFTRLLPVLRAVYADTRFAQLLEEMIEKNSEEPFLTCNDVQLLTSAWTSDTPKRADFLVESAATMPEVALPFALAYVCKSDQTEVVGAYLERLLRQEPPFVFSHTYLPKLIDHAVLEDVVVLFEKLAPIAPSCMEMKIPGLVKRLNADQKQRFALSYATALERNPRVISALPSEDWLLGQLRTAETWQSFAGVFFRCKPGTRVQDASWLGTQLLTVKESPHFAPFEAVVERLPNRDLDPAEWKPIIAGLLARNPGNPILFKKLFDLTGGAEKVAVRECQELQARGRVEEARAQLGVYRETGSFPKPIKAPKADPQTAIREALDKKDMSLALTLLTKSPSPEWELWDQWIKSLPEKPDTSLLERGWTAWLENHPIAKCRLEDELYFEEAFFNLFNKLPTGNPVALRFITHHTIEYALRFHKQLSFILIGLCLEMGIISCWNNKPEQNTAMVRALARIIQNEKLIEKVSDPILLLKEHYQVFLHLLFIGQKEFYDLGNTWFLVSTVISDMSQPLLKGYSKKPYIPFSCEDQVAILNWLEKSWPANSAALDWLEHCRLFGALCEFHVDKMDRGVQVRYFLLMGLIWDHLLSTFPRKNILPLYAELFIRVTKTFLLQAMKHIEGKKAKYKLLIQTHKGIFDIFPSYAPTENFLQFQVDHIAHSFALLPLDFPDEDGLLTTKLTDLSLCIHHLQDHPELLKKVVTALHDALPRILNVSDPSLLQIVFDSLMSTRTSWTPLLVQLCASLQEVSPKRRAAVAKLCCQVFMNCTHPNSDRKLTTSSLEILRSSFLTMPEPECLELERWNALIQGLSNDSMKQMALKLFQETDSFLCHSAIARLIRHTKPANREFLTTLEEFCFRGVGESFHTLNARSQPLMQLRLHSEWISTLSALTQKCKELEREISFGHTACKISMATNLTTTACSLIKDDATYKLYSRYLIEAMGDDLEVAKTIHTALDPGEVESLKKFKKYLEFKIQSLSKIT